MNPAVLFCNIAVLRCCGLDTKYLQNSIISPYLLDIAVIFDITVNQLLYDNTPISFHSLMLILKNRQVIVLNKKEFLLKIIKTIKTTLRNYKSERQERREFISAFLHQSAIKFFIFSNKCK